MRGTLSSSRGQLLLPRISSPSGQVVLGPIVLGTRGPRTSCLGGQYFLLHRNYNYHTLPYNNE